MARKILAVLALGLFLVPLAHADTAEIERIKRSIIKIYTTAAAPDYFNPWALLNAKQLNGSGAVIADNRILTNAHVVANGSYIQVQRHGDAKKYRARVDVISHEADLAVLSVDDESFFEGTRALRIGDLPELQQEVTVYGYPIGGKSLSITRGVLSRVEHQYYAHADSYLMAGQIDAAINPGNSGGPVISGGRIVGVVMQANTSQRAENLGYFVPPIVIRHVLEDAGDGSHDGFPELGAVTQNMESPSMRAIAGLEDDQEGALVVRVFEDSKAAGVLKLGDVILEVDGMEVAEDRTVEWRPNQRTNYHFAIDRHHVGDKIKVKVARDGEEQTLEVELGKPPLSRTLVLAEQYDELPQYYIYGGVVFVPLNMNLIKRWGSSWHSKAPVDFLHARSQWADADRKELVVALKVLPAAINLGYHDWKNWIVEQVNGKPVRDFLSFARMLEDNSEAFVRMEDDAGYMMVLEHEEASRQQPLILETYHIPARHSPGLFDSSAAAGKGRTPHTSAL
ncbi:S1C family serine protease [Biformimicrobium ophioploci]|nr:serine protease [Microbulbifer sp. NKW57]